MTQSLAKSVKGKDLTSKGKRVRQISQVDLHVHSTASDGEHTPAQLVEMALERGLSVLAITDHDSTEGVDAALAAARGTTLEVIPGVEIGTDIPHQEVHLLGYYIDHHHPHLLRELRDLRRSRIRRAKGMIAKLANLGMPIAWERVAELAGDGSVGRPHIAQAMMERGYIDSMNEAFAKYIGRNGPAYVERHKLTPQEATRLIIAVGGLPVLAHPSGVIDLLPGLIEVGLIGLEAYYDGYTEKEIGDLLDLARKYDLIVTGGSDFHSPSGPTPTDLGGVWVPMESVERLKRLQRRQPL